MKLIPASRLGRAATVCGASLATVVAVAIPASAHTPVMLDGTDTVPWTSPLALDGNDPISFFGVIPHAGADRSFQFHMTAGQTVSVSTLIPDLAPENTLSADQLPEVLLIAPDGTPALIKPTEHVAVPIPELNENYVLVDDYSAPAVTGTYSAIVVGDAPARFNVSIGTEGGDFHGLQRGSVATLPQIQAWYATAP
jgi:hypothetical protein